jgi:phosphate acetyltransferase
LEGIALARNLYLASLEPRAGRSVVTLGVMELLTRRLGNVGYFRPVIRDHDDPDPRIDLIRRRFELPEAPEELCAYDANEVATMLADGRGDEVFTGILERYKAIEERHGFVVCDGTDYTGTAAALEFDFNAEVANHLGAPVLAVVNGRERPATAVVEALRLAGESLRAEGCTLAGAIVNRVAPDDLDKVRDLVAAASTPEPVWILPETPLLAMPTVGELADALGCDVDAGSGDLDREVAEVKIAAMTLPRVLDHIQEGMLIVTPGDRADVVLGTLMSHQSTSFPNLAAIILTGGLPLDETVVRLLDGLPDRAVPILRTKADTYATATRIAAVPGAIRAESARKLSTALGLFEEHVDGDELEARVEVVRPERVTPLMFQYELIQRARADRKHVVLPEGTDERILRATETLLRRRIVDLTLLGDEQEVRGRAASLGVDLGEVPIINPVTSPLRERFAATYLEARKHKGITEELALETMVDVSYFGTLMVHEGLADGMVSGAAHTTQHTIRPAFEVIRTSPGTSVVSSVFLMCLPDRVLVYGDCAVNPDPDAEQLASIAISSAETADAFGIEPRVAMLSYSTGESGKGEAVERVRTATQLAREQRPDLQIEGPIQYDAAIDVAVGEAKLPGSQVAGRATVFIFPDLNTGNNTYKAVQRSSGAIAIGPVLQGLNKPVNDLSRGCTVEDVVNTVIITAIQAQG